MLVTALVFVGITLIGGFWAAGLTNVINVIVIYTGIALAAVMSVARVGGLGALEVGLPEAHPGFDLFAMGPALIAAWFLVMVTTTHSTQAVIQVGFAAKDENHAARAYLLGGLLILPVGFVSAVVGMAAAASHPGIVAAEALPRMVMDLPPLAAGIILAGLWAADVSTASALLLGSAALVSSDIVKRFFAPDLSAAVGGPHPDHRLHPGGVDDHVLSAPVPPVVRHLDPVNHDARPDGVARRARRVAGAASPDLPDVDREHRDLPPGRRFRS
jgi:SSS family solute:Na+ symporter